MADRTGVAPTLHQRWLRVGASLFVVVIAMAGCSDGNVSQAERAVVPTPIAAPSGQGPNGEALTLEVVDGGSATGLIITDHRGFALYGVTGETVATELVCTGDCLDVWIPVSPRDTAVADELNIDLYGVFTRADGVEQVSYADIPLYLWSGDRQVGITAGANVAGIWFPLTETGGYIG